MKTAIVMPTAFISTNPNSNGREERIAQYVAGFKQVADLVAKHPEFDVFFVDSTVEDPSTLDARLMESLNSIPNLKKVHFFYNNDYGKKNKGAGVIVQWRGILPFIGDEYEYVIHFEPRQELENFSFFETFLKSPKRYLKVMKSKVKRLKVIPWTITQMWTGLMSLTKQDYAGYCAQADLDKMVFYRTSLESDLYQYIVRKKLPFQNLDTLGILWDDMAGKTKRHI